jgi:hypothetical protein
MLPEAIIFGVAWLQKVFDPLRVRLEAALEPEKRPGWAEPAVFRAK